MNWLNIEKNRVEPLAKKKLRVAASMTALLCLGASFVQAETDPSGATWDLASDHLQTRWDAYRAMIAEGPAAVDVASSLLDESSEVRELAAEVIYRIGSPGRESAAAALPGLIDDLSADDPLVREGAARSLMRLRDWAAPAVPELIAVLASEDVMEVAWAAASALHVIASERLEVRQALAGFVAPRLFRHVDLTAANMAPVRSAWSAGDALTALEAFRDALVDQVAGIEMKTEGFWLFRATEATELLEAGVLRTSHYGKFHLQTRMEIGLPGLVHWHRLPATGYSAILRLLPKALHWNGRLAEAYVGSGDPAYLKAWMGYYGDFARNWEWQHERVVDDPRYAEAMEAGGHPAVSLHWPFVSTLHPAWRLQVFLAWLAAVVSADPEAAKTDLDGIELAETLLAFTEGDLVRGVERLEEPVSYPNQYVKLAASMMKAGVLLDAFSLSDRWRKVAVEGILKYVDNAGYLPDGSDLEQAFNYHVHLVRAVDGFLEAAEAYPPSRAEPPAWVERLREVRRNRVRFTALHQSYLNAPQSDPQGLALDVDSVYFPYGGYALLRDGQGASAQQLYFKNSRPQSGHRWGMDANAVRVNAFGRKLLVDSGILAKPDSWYYSGDAVGRVADYFRSSVSQNTVLVDGYSQDIPPTGGETYADPVPGARWLTTPRFDFIEGAFGAGAPGGDAYGGHNFRIDCEGTGRIDDVRHERSVLFVREAGFWIVEDRLRSAQDRAFTQVWNLHPDFAEDALEIGTEAGRMTARLADGSGLAFYQFGVADKSYRSYRGVDTETQTLGWVSVQQEQESQVYTPSIDLHVDWSGKGTVRLITLILPLAEGEPAPQVEPLGDPEGEVAGFRLRLSPDKVVDYLSSVEGGATLEVDGLRIEAERLLLVQDGASADGLVLGAPEGPTGRDFSFQLKTDGTIQALAPLRVPEDFRWEQSDSGYSPVYD